MARSSRDKKLYEITENKSQNNLRTKLQQSMQAADILGISIASIDGGGKVSTMEIGVSAEDLKSEITADTYFGAASLSKPVFAYLVLKLINDNNTYQPSEEKNWMGKFKNLPTEKKELNLDTPLYEAFPDILNNFIKNDQENAKKITAKMVLSHTTGLPIVHELKDLYLQFEPGTQYGYSGPGIALLQQIIEAITGYNLQELAQEHIFKKEALDMQHTSFHYDKNKPPQAANSLYTTSSDYAKFICAWMNDSTLQYAFEPQVLVDKSKFSMKEAFLPKNWAIKDVALSDADREHVSWGLGLGLQINDNGEAISAYHSGDMSESRAWVAMNLKEKSAIVYFANSHNGHVLAEQIIPSNIKLDHALNFFFQTYGFARNIDELAQEKGDEQRHGLRKNCLSRTMSEEKKSKSTEINSTALMITKGIAASSSYVSPSSAHTLSASYPLATQNNMSVTKKIDSIIDDVQEIPENIPPAFRKK